MGRKTSGTISDSDQLFALEYLKNGHNATAAYKTAHPRAKQRTAEVEGSKLLRKPEVIDFVEAELKERKRRLQMDGDESLESITRIARGDIRRLFKNNRLLPLDEWPDDAADCVKAIKPTPFGTSIVFHDKLKARELMAVATGKLRTKVDATHRFDPAEYLGAEPPAGDDD